MTITDPQAIGAGGRAAPNSRANSPASGVSPEPTIHPKLPSCSRVGAATPASGCPDRAITARWSVNSGC